MQAAVSGATLTIGQRIALDAQGSVRVTLAARDSGGRVGASIASLVEEDVRERIADAIHYTGWLLERIDPTHRLSRVAVACRLDGVGYLPWRTRAEATASPSRANISLSDRESADSPPVVLPRPALLMDGARQVEDTRCICGARRVASRGSHPVEVVEFVERVVERTAWKSPGFGCSDSTFACHRCR